MASVEVNSSPWPADSVSASNGCTVSTSPPGSTACPDIGMVTASPARTDTRIGEATGATGSCGAGTETTRTQPMAEAPPDETWYENQSPPAGTARRALIRTTC